VIALPSAGLQVRDYDLLATIDSNAGERTVSERICVGAA
jgi:hypothetical protein